MTSRIRYLDLETTGLEGDSDVVEIAILNEHGHRVRMMRPGEKRMANTTTSKHAIRQLKKTVRECRQEYADARWVALAAGYQARCRATPRSRIIREDALNAALSARTNLQHYARLLAAAQALPVVAHGGHWSPAALARNGFDPTGA